MTTEKLEVQIVEDRGSTNKLIASVNGLAAASDKLAGSTEKSTAATAKADTQAAKTSQTMGTLERSVGNVSKGFGLISGALAGFIGAAGIEKAVSLADTFTNMSNKLRLVTTDQTKLNDIIDKSFKIAQQTSTGFESVTNTYGKVSIALKRYGGDAKDAEGITRTIARAIQLSGASAEDAATSLRQFGQTLESGQVQAEELNSIIDATPGLARAIEAGLSKAGITVEGSLKKMAENGSLSVKQILEALKTIAPEIDKFGSGALPTVSQAFTRLQNEALKYVGSANEGGRATNILIGAIDLLARNLDIVIPALVIFGGLIALGAVAGAVNSIGQLVGAFRLLTPAIGASTAVMLTNPLFLIATVAAIAAIGVGIALFGDKIAALTQKLGPAAIAALGLTTATQGTATASSAAAPALQAQATSAGNLGTASATAAPLVASVGNASTVAAAAIVQAGTATKTASVGFTEVAATSKGAALGFTEVGLKSVDAGNGFTEVGLKSAIANKGFTEITMSAPKAAAGISETGVAAAPAAKAVESLGGSLEKASVSTDSFNKTSKDIKPIQEANAASMDQAAKALTEISRRTEEADKAAAAYKRRLELLSGDYNQFGEKLETTAERLRRVTEAQSRSDDAIRKSLDNLRQYYPVADRTATSIDGIASSADKASGSIARLDGSIDGINDGSGFANIARNLDSVTSSANNASSALSRMTSAQEQAQNRANNPTLGDSVADTVRRSAGTGKSLVNNDPEIAGSFSRSIYHGIVTYNGTPIGAYVSRDVYSAKDIAAHEIAAENFTDTISSAKTIAEARRMLPYDTNFRPIVGGVFAGNFAHGGSFKVGGNGGTDSQMVSFMASPSERVTVETPDQQYERRRAMDEDAPVTARSRQNVNLTFNIKSDDTDEFKRNRKQIAQDAAYRLSRAR